MAKVQEAKEIPTVKVLDPPQIPDKKSYPPRTLIVFVGTVLAVTVAVVFLFLQDTSGRRPMRAMSAKCWLRKSSPDLERICRKSRLLP